MSLGAREDVSQGPILVVLVVEKEDRPRARDNMS